MINRKLYGLGLKVLSVCGLGLWALSLSESAAAQAYITYNEPRTSEAINAILAYIEGTFGALVMVSFAVLGLALLCFRRWGWGGLSLALALLAFLLRSFVTIFFNDQNIRAAVPGRLPALAQSIDRRVLVLAQLEERGLISSQEEARGREVLIRAVRAA